MNNDNKFLVATLNKLTNEIFELKEKYNNLLKDYDKLKNSKIISLGGIIDITQRFEYSNQSIDDIANYYNVSADFIISILINNKIINNFNELSLNAVNYISDDDLTFSSSESDKMEN
jgi:hypothetical protein